MDQKQVATAVAAMRVGYGASMAVAPRRMLRLQTGTEPSGPFVWLGRVFGVRDAVLGAGALLAADEQARRSWVAAGAVSDGLDAVSALVGTRQLGRGRAVFVALTGASAAAAGVFSLRR